MDAADMVSLVSRWLHILAAITLLGGSIFALLVFLPSLAELSPENRQRLHAAARARWARMAAAAIALLLLSGLYNYVTIIRTYDLPRWYHPLIGVKIILAVIVFLLVSLLSGKTAAAQKLRENARAWMSVNILLAVGIVCIGGVLHCAVKTVKPPKAASEIGSRMSEVGMAEGKASAMRL